MALVTQETGVKGLEAGAVSIEDRQVWAFIFRQPHFESCAFAPICLGGLLLGIWHLLNDHRIRGGVDIASIIVALQITYVIGGSAWCLYMVLFRPAPPERYIAVTSEGLSLPGKEESELLPWASIAAVRPGTIMDDRKLHIDLYPVEDEKSATLARVVSLRPFISRHELVRNVCRHFLDHPEDRSLICTPEGWDLDRKSVV